MKIDEKDRALMWLLANDSGLSSKAILAVMLGIEQDFYYYPHDAGDFGRCYRLLKLMPEWRYRILEMSNVSKEWEPISKNWGEIEMLYESEDFKGVYDKIQECLPIYESDDLGILKQ